MTLRPSTASVILRRSDKDRRRTSTDALTPKPNLVDESSAEILHASSSDAFRMTGLVKHGTRVRRSLYINRAQTATIATSPRQGFHMPTNGTAAQVATEKKLHRPSPVPPRRRGHGLPHQAAALRRRIHHRGRAAVLARA